MEAALLIETSGRGGLIGLADGDRVVHSVALDESRRHARDLAESVRRLLVAATLKPADISSVIVSIGPGSYTGLRVGLTSAKAFAYAVGCPLVAVPTFAAIIGNLPGGYDLVHVIADALQNHVFVETFGNEMQSIEPLRIVSIQDLRLTHAVTGPGVAIYDSHISTAISRVEESRRMPTLQGLLRASRGMKPLSRAEMFAIEPLYLRGSSAEEKRKAQSEPVSASSAS